MKPPCLLQEKFITHFGASTVFWTFLNYNTYLISICHFRTFLIFLYYTVCSTRKEKPYLIHLGNPVCIKQAFSKLLRTELRSSVSTYWGDGFRILMYTKIPVYSNHTVILAEPVYRKSQSSNARVSHPLNTVFSIHIWFFKNMHKTGPTQFKFLLFKGQL